MASNWAIVIGINQYRFLQPLNYAKRDAETMCSFLTQEAKFDRIFLFTDDSPAIGGKATEPFRANLLRVLRQIFAAPFMKDGDNFWFFFSGHGIPHNGQDYLMPLDGDPEDIENTGISTNTITNYLRSCGADNAVMILDACRSRGLRSGEGIGRQTEAEARQTGVISLFSCSPDQYSYELEAIGQGAFTYALLEGLGIRGRCATVERLNQYLEHRVPELVSQHLQRARQIPYTIAEPLNRSHLILMPQHASLTDIATLKNDAYRAQMNQNWDLAQRLWIRVNAAASGSDMEAIEALQNLGIQRHTGATPPQPKSNQASKLSKTIPNSTVKSKNHTSAQFNLHTSITPSAASKHSPALVTDSQPPSLNNWLNRYPKFNSLIRESRKAAISVIGAVTMIGYVISLLLSHESQQPSPGGSPITTNSTSPSTKSSAKSESCSYQQISKSASPDQAKLEAVLINSPKIADVEKIKDLQQTLYDCIDRNWREPPTYDQDLVYQVGVRGDGAIIGYKPENLIAKVNINQTPLSNLLLTQTVNSFPTSEPIAKYKVIFKVNGVLEVSTSRP